MPQGHARIISNHKVYFSFCRIIRDVPNFYPEMMVAWLQIFKWIGNLAILVAVLVRFVVIIQDNDLALIFIQDCSELMSDSSTNCIDTILIKHLRQQNWVRVCQTPICKLDVVHEQGQLWRAIIRNGRTVTSTNENICITTTAIWLGVVEVKTDLSI